MNIAFLSSLNPEDIHNWSGTLYFMYRTLCKKFSVTWVGGDLFQEAMLFHQKNETAKVSFQPEDYSKVFGMILSKTFRNNFYDLIICRDYFFLADLYTDIPIIYLGDTTFKLFNDYLHISDLSIIKRNDTLERKSITNATIVVYPSMWAKESAVNNYKKKDESVEIIEFGANLEYVPIITFHKINNVCRLLFIGSNWHMKGGKKAMAIHNNLLNIGIKSHLTIVGCSPDYVIDDETITIYPWVDKSSTRDVELFDEILKNSDFLIAPTLFDCFGIVNCEAAAYGLPVMTVDVGGVNQVVKDGINGFLFQPDSTAEEWANKILNLILVPNQYLKICKQARNEYEKRLNWECWSKRMENLINKLVRKPDVYIPVYVINIKERTDRRKHILSEFHGRDEFEFHLIEACVDPDGRMGLWRSIVSIIEKAKENSEQVIIICEDDHFFTKSYSAQLLIYEIQKAYQMGADILSGGVGGFGNAIPVASRLYQVDWFWCTQFIIVYSSLFDRILSYQFKDSDTADGILSHIATSKMVIYPFISEQMDFGYSDVTQSNREHTGRIREHFSWANKMFNKIENMYNIKSKI